MTLHSPMTFANAVGISARVARRAFARRCWRGHALPVVEVAAQRGGAGGRVLMLALDHCSPELRAMLLPAASLPREAPVEGAIRGPITDVQIAEQQARLRIIRPILDAPQRSRERAARAREVAAQPQDYPGGAQTFAYDTLRAWVAAYERDGLSGLLPKPRADRNRRRVLVTREWDAGIDLHEDRKRAIAAELTLAARSMVANDGVSDREALRLCGFKLARLSEAAGSTLPAARLRAICALNTKWAKRQGLGRFRLVRAHDRDHKAWQDRAVPRIRRALHDTPMGLLIGDVHYVDILVSERQEPVRIRLIAWIDASSLFAWVTPVFLSKGMGITQENVAESLAQVAFCPYGGLPQEFYLDNGSEYAALAAAMARLANLAEMSFGLTSRSPTRPRPKAKSRASSPSWKAS